MEYTIKYSSGIEITKTGSIRAAKMEATRGLAYGAGDVTIMDGVTPVCRRRFFESGRRFWWGRWEWIDPREA